MVGWKCLVWAWTFTLQEFVIPEGVGTKGSVETVEAQKLFIVNIKIRTARPYKNVAHPDLPNPLVKQWKRSIFFLHL